jgi:hypothetical protein
MQGLKEWSMKRLTVSVLVGAFGLVACKTSQFRGKAQEAETAVEEAKVQTTIPKVSSSNAPANVPVTSTVIDSSTTDLQLNQSCEKPVQLLMSQVKLSFAESKKCAFNVEPNKAPLDAHLQAQKISTMDLKLPENSEICSMKLETPANAQVQYDDFLILAIDDFVIFSSNGDFLPKLDKINGLYKWDFLKVRESPVDFKALPYCIGAMDRCTFPGTDTVGPIRLNLNYSEISGIAKAIQGKVQVPVDLIATGDNDDSADKMDCFHTALDLTVTLQYIKKPK